MIEQNIRGLLFHRNDLSTFLVHLTRDTEDGNSARKNLRLILKKEVLKARNPFGPAKHLSGKENIDSQKCVSFSEVPLAHVHSLTLEIPKRSIRLSPYGLAFTKTLMREKGVNPVWYVDITSTSNREWLMKPVNQMIKEEHENSRRDFWKSPIAKICPFIEPMGKGARRDGGGYKKEFWWEREWRHQGNFSFGYSTIAFGLAPEDEIDKFESFVRQLRPRNSRRIRFLDPSWNSERMIAHLCSCSGALTPFDDDI